MSFIIKHKSIQGNKTFRADEFFYQAGKVLWLPFCLAGFWFAATGYDRYGELVVCAVRRRCGLPCPGCGGTRAFYYLFQGEFLKSFQLNPTVIFGVAAYIHFMLLCYYRKHISGSFSRNTIRIPYYLYAAIGVILMQWGIKLIKILSFII